MKLSERQRGFVLWGSRFVFLGAAGLAITVLPETWAIPVVFAGGAAFMVSWVALGATSILDGGAARSARTPSGYRGLDLRGGESGRSDRTPSDPS